MLSNIINNNLCISCGLCAAVCPVKCINFKRVKGMNLPLIDSQQCNTCGTCYRICPGKIACNGGGSASGKALRVLIARTKNKTFLANSVSGGVVTELINDLLNDNIYSQAFTVQDNNYNDFPSSELTRDIKASQKSRYLPVSYQHCAEYILTHQSEKIILTGVPCFVQGIMNIISEFGLKRENYFIIGLFCDRTMSMNVIDYFRNHKAAGNGMKEFYFRTKDSGGWPGGVRIICSDGSIVDLPNTERMKVKDYFQPERCLYCPDKLNILADISCGDNYTGKFYNDSLGSSSVIIRTKTALDIWARCVDKFEAHETDLELIAESQHMKEREINYFFYRIKTGYNVKDISPEIIKLYRKRLSLIKTGEVYREHPKALINSMRHEKFKALLLRLRRKTARLVTYLKLKLKHVIFH